MISMTLLLLKIYRIRFEDISHFKWMFVRGPQEPLYCTRLKGGNRRFIIGCRR